MRVAEQQSCRAQVCVEFQPGSGGGEGRGAPSYLSQSCAVSTVSTVSTVLTLNMIAGQVTSPSVEQSQ